MFEFVMILLMVFCFALILERSSKNNVLNLIHKRIAKKASSGSQRQESLPADCYTLEPAQLDSVNVEEAC